MPNGSDQVVQDAFAVVFLDHNHTAARTRAFGALGANWIDPQFTLTVDGFGGRWTTRAPVGSASSFDSAGRWVATGAMSREDGNPRGGAPGGPTGDP